MQHTADSAGTPPMLVLSPQNVPARFTQLSPGSISSPQRPCAAKANGVACGPAMLSMEPSPIIQGARIQAQLCPGQCCPRGTAPAPSAPRGTPWHRHPLCRRCCRMEKQRVPAARRSCATGSTGSHTESTVHLTSGFSLPCRSFPATGKQRTCGSLLHPPGAPSSRVARAGRDVGTGGFVPAAPGCLLARRAWVGTSSPPTMDPLWVLPGLPESQPHPKGWARGRVGLGRGDCRQAARGESPPAGPAAPAGHMARPPCAPGSTSPGIGRQCPPHRWRGSLVCKALGSGVPRAGALGH